MLELIIVAVLGNLFAFTVLIAIAVGCLYAVSRILQISADQDSIQRHSKYYPIFDRVLEWSTYLDAEERRLLFEENAVRHAFSVFINCQVLVGLNTFPRIPNNCPVDQQDFLSKILRQCDNSFSAIHIAFNSEDVVITLRQSGKVLEEVTVTDPGRDLKWDYVKNLPT